MGLVGCVTTTRNGDIVGQRLSRIGGLISVNSRTGAITTAHGMLEPALSLVRRGIAPQDNDNSDTDSFPSSPAWSTKRMNPLLYTIKRATSYDDWEESLGQVDPNTIDEWCPVQILTNTFLGRMIQI